ncbi:MAG: protein-L-isoaspartate(D-aspartate) O-methyltransferase [Candidatus Abyssobacteria bacterium SURF_5]|uniref:Protein-L-isoaspartate O-methyltransferase n=1 Tax=Abyssobacteria bacterium (strain SURF_5) TaxID=2093360 RepID=A0A3A4NMX4_ABYX5|nr:MAG: protein-L-isoaspartate(D-aspartate) O-methyltransferase [Candidatus Abyssubacteria bacterium SURF_5]
MAALAPFACAERAENPAPVTAGTQKVEQATQILWDRLINEIHAQGVSDPKVLAAMRKVPRHEFVPKRFRAAAYDNRPLPIGLDQTISQPYIVGYMTQALGLEGGEKVLEIGTGSGYQAAVLAEIAGQVYTIEILESLARDAERTLARLGYRNVHVKAGDGYQGWPEHAPFDAIIVTAAPDHIPQPLVEQLKENGRMVIPVGSLYQRIIILTKGPDGVTEQMDLPVRFVPMTGEAQTHGRD